MASRIYGLWSIRKMDIGLVGYPFQKTEEHFHQSSHLYSGPANQQTPQQDTIEAEFGEFFPA